MSTTDAAPRLPGLDLAFAWAVTPSSWQLAPSGSLTVEAPGGTDLFVDPSLRRPPILNAPRLLAPVGGADFVFTARITVDFAATFDAGVLLLWANDRSWAKLCFEYSPRGEPMVVSVVTRTVSDDCDSVVVDGSSTWMRIARTGSSFAFHRSTDGRDWRLVRHFGLADTADLQVGFEGQAPRGSSCRVVFDEIRFERRTLSDIRSGE